MKTWNIRRKLLFAFAIVTVFTTLLGAVGIIGLNILNGNEHKMYEIARSANATSTLSNNVQKQYSAFRGAVINYYIDADFSANLAEISALDNEFITLLSAQEAAIPPEEDFAVRLLADTRSIYTNEYIPILNALITALSSGDKASIQELLPNLTVPLDKVNSNMETFSAAGIELINVTNTEDSKTANLIIVVMFALLALTILAAIRLALASSGKISIRAKFMKELLAKMGREGVVHLTEEEYHQAEMYYDKEQDEISDSINMLVETGHRLENVGIVIETVANGDLTAEINVLSSQDKVGDNLKKMLDNLNNIFSSVNQSTAKVASGSKQIADSAQILAQSSAEQSSAVEQLSSSVSEITQKTRDNAHMAANAASLADTIKQSAEKGSVQMNNMMTAVNEINDASQNINKVIKVIDEIAFQTNILALNAAVEAARAGQHGKGFAVVANEVRSLAAKSAEAARDTGGLIANSIEKAELGARIATETAASLQEIVVGINESTQLVSEIAKSSDEQAQNISQLNRGIEQVAEATQKNSASAEESSAVSEVMSNQADVLNNLVQQFKIRNNI